MLSSMDVTHGVHCRKPCAHPMWSWNLFSRTFAAPACAAASSRPRTWGAATTTLASARIPRSADRTSTLGKGSP